MASSDGRFSVKVKTFKSNKRVITTVMIINENTKTFRLKILHLDQQNYLTDFEIITPSIILVMTDVD